MSKQLVVFYSRADENYVSGQIKQLSVGNTEIVAQMLAQLSGADLFKLEQVYPYAAAYNECIEQAQQDQRKDARPELAAYPDNFDMYDIVYLGYPNYWNTMPMAVFTFLEHFNFKGKVIRPFCTHEGSGFGNSVRDIKRLCPEAAVEDGFELLGSSAGRSEKKIEAWLRQNER